MDGAPVVQNLAGKTLDDCTLLTPLGVGRGGTTVWKAARPDGSLAAVKIIEDAGNRAAFETAIKTVIAQGAPLTYDLVGEEKAAPMSAVTTAILEAFDAAL